MKKIKMILTGSILILSLTVLAQEKKEDTTTNKGTTAETVITTVKVNNGDGTKELTKEVTTEKQTALVLAEKDKNKLNQSFKESPVKTTQTTIVKDGDQIVSKDVEVYYTKGNDKYVLQQSQDDISYTKEPNIPEDAFLIKDNDGEGVCYFTPEGTFCVEYRDEASGTMQRDTYTREK